MIDFYAGAGHYAAHLWPIWQALPEGCRGRFYAQGGGHRALGDAAHHGAPHRGDTPVVVAGYPDYQATRKWRRVVLVNHGAGQSYDGDPSTNSHPCYVGGRDRDGILGFLEPGPIAAAKTGECEQVGVPYLDAFRRLPPPEGQVIAVSHHWRCRVCPEADWAWPEFRHAISDLARRYTVIGHGHPRAWTRLERWYRSVGIEPVADWFEVLRRASVYVCDNSSTIFEFASLGRPVVLLNSRSYRRDVEHGLRFWSEAQVGYQVDEAADLEAAVQAALSPDPVQDRLRSQICERVYAWTDDRCAERAADAVRKVTGCC